jgi:hypothetical protein
LRQRHKAAHPKAGSLAFTSRTQPTKFSEKSSSQVGDEKLDQPIPATEWLPGVRPTPWQATGTWALLN